MPPTFLPFKVESFLAIIFQIWAASRYFINLQGILAYFVFIEALNEDVIFMKFCKSIKFPSQCIISVIIEHTHSTSSCGPLSSREITTTNIDSTHLQWVLCILSCTCDHTETTY